MSSVSSTNPLLANLLQTLSTVNSPVLSSPAALSAIDNAPPADIIQLSVAATELEGVDAIFGGISGNPDNSEATNLLGAFDPTASQADPLSAEAAALLDAGFDPSQPEAASASSTGSLFDALG
jgi:hypothetical protein